MTLTQLYGSHILNILNLCWGSLSRQNLNLALFSCMRSNLFALLFKFVFKMSKYCCASIVINIYKGQISYSFSRYYHNQNLFKFQLVYLGFLTLLTAFASVT